VDSTADFNLVWNNLGGSTIAIVQLLILDSSSNIVFATPAPFQIGALNGASNQCTIPGFSLPAGTNLIGHLTIANPGTPNTNSYPGAGGVPALAKDTYFSMITRPAPARPHLNVRPGSPGYFNLRITGETNRIYHLEGTGDFLSWTTLLTTNSGSGVIDYADPEPVEASRRFYRARVGQ
jgi:hypothetical protein